MTDRNVYIVKNCDSEEGKKKRKKKNQHIYIIYIFSVPRAIIHSRQNCIALVPMQQPAAALELHFSQCMCVCVCHTIHATTKQSCTNSPARFLCTLSIVDFQIDFSLSLSLPHANLSRVEFFFFFYLFACSSFNVGGTHANIFVSTICRCVIDRIFFIILLRRNQPALG